MNRPAAVITAIIIVAAFGLAGWFTHAASKPPDPVIPWARNLAEKCKAMGGTYHFDKEAKKVSCYRHPIARMTKHLFTEEFKQ
jgi:hypothetical protein